MRKQFTMTQEQYDKIIAACKPVPYLVIGGQEPSSPQENANRAWEALGEELGFLWETVEPGSTKYTFFAEPRPKPGKSDGPKPLNYLMPRPPAAAIHLGDGAYAEFDGFHIWLRANSHLRAECTGEIALEPGALINLLSYIQLFWKIGEYVVCEEE